METQATAASSLFDAWKAYAKTTSNDAPWWETPETSDPSSPPKTEGASDSRQAATGDTGSRLSAETLAELIKAIQASAPSSASTLPPAEQRHLDRIATDPVYAADQAWAMGQGVDFGVDKTLTYGEVAMTEDERANLPRLVEASFEAQQGRQALYKSEVAAGTPPAKIYAKLLAFNTDLPESYAEGLSRADTWATEHKGRLDYLKTALDITADAQATEAATKPENGYLREIANNPEYAAQQAKITGNSYDLQFFPTWEAVEAYMRDPSTPKIDLSKDNASHPIVQNQRQRAALYEKLVAEGRSSTEIILEIYRFNASLPESYSDLLDPTGQSPVGNYKQQQEDNIKQLEQYLAEAQEEGASAASSDSTNSFERRVLKESDRKLLEAMTGYRADEYGQFYDENGEPFYPGGLENHALRSFAMMLDGARRGYPEDAIKGDIITPDEFSRMMKQVRASSSQMGEVFPEDLLTNGLAYLNGTAA